MKTIRGELDKRTEEIRLLEQNKQFLMNENTSLKNRMKVLTSVDKNAVENSIVEKETYGEVVETISALTVAMECTVENYDSIRSEFEQFKQQQKAISQQLEHIHLLRNNVSAQHLLPPLNSADQAQLHQQNQNSLQNSVQQRLPHQCITETQGSLRISPPKPPPPPPPLPPLPPMLPSFQPPQTLPQRHITKQTNPFKPLQFVNNNSEETASRSWFKPVRPGFKSYSEIASGSKKSTVISTSITKGIRPHMFREHYTQGKAMFHRFHGGKAKHIRNQIETHLQEDRPDAVIIQIGGNDLSAFRGEILTPVIEIANNIIDSALLCKTYNVKDVCVSSVLPRKESYMKNTEDRRRELNMILKSLCDIHNFIFIDNDVGEERIVYPQYMYNSVHLTNDASSLLSRKFGDVLNDLHRD